MMLSDLGLTSTQFAVFAGAIVFTPGWLSSAPEGRRELPALLIAASVAVSLTRASALCRKP